MNCPRCGEPMLALFDETAQEWVFGCVPDRIEIEVPRDE